MESAPPAAPPVVQKWRCDTCFVKSPLTAWKCISCETPNSSLSADVIAKHKLEESEKEKNLPEISPFTLKSTSDFQVSSTSGFPFNTGASSGFAFTPSTDTTATSGNFPFIPVKRSIVQSEITDSKPEITCTPSPASLSFDPEEVKKEMISQGFSPANQFALVAGCGDMSQLGLGFEEREAVTPTPVPGTFKFNVVAVAAGSLHNLVLSSDGKVYSWGCNDDGALGRETVEDEDEFEPKLVSGLEGHKVVAIACGASHSLALTKDGLLFSWGAYRDASGLVGFDVEQKVVKHAVELTGFDSPVAKIAAGESHSLALTDSGKVYYWGDTFIGRRASDRTKRSRLIPRQIPITLRRQKVNGRDNLAKGKEDIDIVDVFAGGYLCAALSRSGKLWVWGPNNYAQCGIPRHEDDEEDTAIVVPSLIPYFIDNQIRVKSCASSSHFTLVLAEDGRIFAFGRTTDGRLGQPKDYKFDHGIEQQTPLEISSLSPKTLSSDASWMGTGEGFDDERHELFRQTKKDEVVKICCGEAHSFAVTKAGRLYGWGNGDLNQIGCGKDETVYTPTWVSSRHLTSIPRLVLQASAGSQHSIFLAKDFLGTKAGKKFKNKKN